MRVSFFRKSDKYMAKKLPKSIQKHIVAKYNLLPEYVETLRCFESESMDTKVGNNGRCFRVFSPYMVEQSGLKQLNGYSDLEQNPGLILYEGHMDNHGKLDVTDMRIRKYELDDDSGKYKNYWF